MESTSSPCAAKAPAISPRAARNLFLLVLAAATGGYLFYIWHNSFLVGGKRFFSLFDDAMISMRYARNLADGHGLRWNAGDPPVEGYTNLLWTLYMACIHLLPIAISKTSLAVMLTGAGVLIGNLFVVKGIAEELAPEDRLMQVAAVFLTACYYPLIYWTLRGMEVGVLSLFTLLGVLLVFRLERKWSGGALGLLAAVLAAALLTRPDAVVPAALITLFLLIAGWRQGVRGGLLVVPLVLVAVCAGLVAFRMAYYGEPVPNTYYLKVGGVSLWERVSRGVTVLVEEILYHFWPVLLVAAAGLVRHPRQFLCSRWGLLLGLIAAQAAYSVYVGGDAWEWMNFANRYLAIVAPLLFLLAARAVTILVPADGKLLNTLLPFLGLGLLFHAGQLASKGEKNAAIILGALAVLMTVGGALFAFWNNRARFAPVLAALAPLLCIAITMNFFGYAAWLTGKNNGFLTKVDAESTRFGLQLKETLDKSTTIAVVWAGAIPYFSELRCIDLLGKSDPVIAKGKPHLPFWPGHNKWDYAYSIRTYHPDVILGLWKATEEDKAMVLNAGYLFLNNMYYSKEYMARLPVKAPPAPK
ncbi:MAG: hypothetical protein WCH57_03520 [Verrucomicrobiota bacterium]